MGRYIREEKVCNDEEKGRAYYEHVVVILVNSSKRARSGFGDYVGNLHQRSLSYQSEVRFRAESERAFLLATLTMKCDAAARPITLLLSAMGRTSAPYSQVVLLSIPSRWESHESAIHAQTYPDPGN